MAEASASGGGRTAAGGGIGDGFTNLAAEDSEDELRSSEWEARLASGDLPEDFLRVTEPTGENRDEFAIPWNKADGPDNDLRTRSKLYNNPVEILMNCAAATGSKSKHHQSESESDSSIKLI